RKSRTPRRSSAAGRSSVARERLTRPDRVPTVPTAASYTSARIPRSRHLARGRTTAPPRARIPASRSRVPAWSPIRPRGPTGRGAIAGCARRGRWPPGRRRHVRVTRACPHRGATLGRRGPARAEPPLAGPGRGEDSPYRRQRPRAPRREPGSRSGAPAHTSAYASEVRADQLGVTAGVADHRGVPGGACRREGLPDPLFASVQNADGDIGRSSLPRKISGMVERGRDVALDQHASGVVEALHGPDGRPHDIATDFLSHREADVNRLQDAVIVVPAQFNECE